MTPIIPRFLTELEYRARNTEPEATPGHPLTVTHYAYQDGDGLNVCLLGWGSRHYPECAQLIAAMLEDFPDIRVNKLVGHPLAFKVTRKEEPAKRPPERVSPSKSRTKTNKKK